MKYISFARLALSCSLLLGILTNSKAQTPNYGTVTGSNISVNVPGNFGGNYYAGHAFIFLSNASIPGGATTLSINGQAPRNLYKNVNQNLSAGDILAGQAVQVLYDGTNFQVLNVGSASTSTGAGTGNLYPFRAISTSTGTAITSGATIPFNVEEFDPNNVFDPVSYAFIAPEAGYYHFDAAVGADQSGVNYLHVFLKHTNSGGTSIRELGGATYNTSSATTNGSDVSGNFAMNTGDRVVVYVNAASGTLNPLSTSAYRTHFSGFKINGGGTLTITSFSGSTASGISTLNGLTTTSQNFSTSSTGTSVNIVSSGNTHNFNIPLASVVGGNNITVTGSFPLYTISGLAGGTSTSQWVSTTGGIFYNGGNVGIGTSSPGQVLDITNGNGIIRGLGNFTGPGLSATMYLGDINNYVSAQTYLGVMLKAFGTSSGITVREASGYVGIDNPNPVARLDVNGDARISGPLTITSFAGAGTQALGVNNLGQLVTIAGGTSTSQWSNTTTGIYYNNGTVEIGQSNQATDSQLKIYSTAANQNVLTLESNLASNVAGPGPMLQFRQRWWGGNQDMIATGGIQGYKDIPTGFYGGGLKFFTMPNGGPSLVERMFLTNTGRLGLGTSTPGASFDVNGDARFTGPLTITTLSTGGTTQALGVNNLGQLVTITGGTSTSQWVTTTGGIYYSGGNVAVGNITPNEALTIQGNTSATGIAYSQSLNVFQTGNQASFLRTDATGSAQNYIEFWTGRYSANVTRDIARWQLGLNQGATGTDDDFFGVGRNGIGYDFKINRKGFVGIGSPGFYPQVMLDVEGDARIGGLMTITSFAGNGTQALGVNNLGQLVTIAGGTSTSQWVSDAGGIYYNNGSVSIGTTSNATFAPLSSAKPNGTGTIRASFGATDTNNSTFMIAHPSPGLAVMGAYFGQDLSISSIANDNSSYIPLTTFKSNGFVGIATSTPGANLDVNGNARFSGPVSITGLAGATTQALGVNSLGQLVTITGGTSTSQWVSTTNGIYYSGGNIGLRINPQYDLHFFNPSAGLSTRFETPVSTGIFNTIEFQTGIYNSSTTRSNALWQWGMVQNGTAANPNDRMYIGRAGISSTDFGIYRDGNVGIGLTGVGVPSEKLTVLGNISASGTGYFSTIAGLALNGAAVGSIVTVDGIGRLGFGALPSSSTSQWVSTTGGIYYNGGNVGIGATSGTNKVVVSDDIINGGILKLQSTHNQNGDNWWIGFVHGGSTSDANDRARIGVAQTFSGAGEVYITTGVAGSQVERLRVNQGGNVGIATSTPGALLDVNGNARFAGPVSISGLATGGTTQALGVNNLGQLVTIPGSTSTTQWVTTTGGIYYNGGNVGIGSTFSPIYPLDVNGNAVIRPTFCVWCDGLNLIAPLGTGKGLIIHEAPVGTTTLNASTGRYYLGMTSASPIFNFIGNGLTSGSLTNGGSIAELSTVNGGTFNVSGRIGIGTPTPVASLDVNGNARLLGNLTITSFAGSGTQALGVNNLGQLVTIPGSSNAITTLNTLTTTSQTFSTSSTGTSINITSSGSVHNFNIPVVTVVGGNNVTITGGFPSYTITGKPNTPSNWTDSGGDTYHYTGGNVGINTPSAPTVRFEVNGNNSSSSTSSLEEMVRFGSTDNAALRLGVWMQVHNSPQSRYMALNAISGTTAPGNLLLQISGGNVAIGNTIPNEKLLVQGNISTTGTLFAGTLVGNNLTGAAGSIVTVDGLGRLGLGSLPNTASSQWVSTTGGIYYNGGTVTNYGTISAVSSANPHIYLNNPSVAVGAATEIAINNNAGGTSKYFALGVNNGGRNFYIFPQGASSDALNIDYSGNVGIGLPLGSSINAKLTVNGNASISGIATLGGLNLRNLVGPGTVTVDGLGRLGVSTAGGSSITGSGTTNGVAFWSNATTLTSDGASFIYTPSTKSLKIGNVTLSSNSVPGNIFLGDATGPQNMDPLAVDNVFIGSNTGIQNTIGHSNTFIGKDAGHENTIGDFNNYFGEQSGYNNITGSHNNAMGYFAGYGNISGAGSNNNSFGQAAGLNNEGDGNNFIGTFAGTSNTSGSYNNFIGQSAGYINTIGSDNIFIGQSSGLNNINGNENIAIGKNTGFNSSNLQYSIAIGSYASVGGSNMMALGGVGLYAVNVGIGTALPQNTLDVVGGARIRNLSIAGAVFANSNGDLYVNTTTSNNLWTVAGTALRPTNTSYGVNVGSNVTTSGVVNISSTTNSGLVVSSYNLPPNTGAIMTYSYSSSTAGIGAFVTNSNAVGVFGTSSNSLSTGLEGSNSAGGTAIRASGTANVNPLVTVDHNGTTGIGLRVNLANGTNSATGLLIITPSTATSQAMDISGKVQLRNYTNGTLTVDGVGNLGVSPSSSAGPGAGFLALSTVNQSIVGNGTNPWNQVQFPNEQFDDANAFNPASVPNGFVAPSSGVYQVNASVPFSNIGQVDIAVFVASTPVIVNSVSTSPTTGVVTSVNISGIVKLSAGNQVFIQVRQFTGSNQSTAASSSGTNASFSMVRLY